MLKTSNIQRILLLLGLSFTTMVFDPALGWTSTSYIRLANVFQTEWVIQAVEEVKTTNKDTSSPAYFDDKKAKYIASTLAKNSLYIQERAILSFEKYSHMSFQITRKASSFYKFS